MLPLVAIVGRPNVGKSTLFNRMMGRRTALVADEPGMTRDRHYGTVTHEQRTFLLIDTGGFEPLAESGLESLIAEQTRLAIDEADLILLLWDTRDGATAADEHIVDALRRASRPVIHVANKVDGPKQEALIGELYRIGMDRVWPVSAEHGLGIGDLMDEIIARLPPSKPDAAPEDPAIHVALVGRPNAGKSALLNRLAGAQRAIVSDAPGTTRDPIDVRIETKRGSFVLVDTAGIRRRKAAGPGLERLAAIWSMRRIAEAEVACLLIDVQQGPTVQDAKIAKAALDAGRALVIVLSKADLLPRPLAAARKRLRQLIDDRLAFAAFAPRVEVSAETGRGVQGLLASIQRARSAWETRVGTPELNRFLEQVTAEHPPPSHRGRAIRLLYISQPQTRPPTFVIHASRPEGIPMPYRRYVANRLRERFGFEATPLRVFFRQRSQPGQRGQRGRPTKGHRRR